MVETYTTLVEDSGGGGLPQLDASSYEEQIVWLFLTFFVLYFVVSKVALPRIGTVLVAREETIAEDLDTAERRKRESDEVKEA